MQMTSTLHRPTDGSRTISVCNAACCPTLKAGQGPRCYGPRSALLAAAPQTRAQPRSLTKMLAQPAPKAAAPTSILVDNPVGQLVAGLVGTPVFLAMEVSALLVLLALTDAAYSGDWSRIGVISAETEPLLQKLAIIAWSGHVVCGLIAANIASKKGRSPASAAVKAFLFGSLHVFEQAVLEPVAADGKTAAANPTARR